MNAELKVVNIASTLRRGRGIHLALPGLSKNYLKSLGSRLIEVSK